MILTLSQAVLDYNWVVFNTAWWTVFYVFLLFHPKQIHKGRDFAIIHIIKYFARVSTKIFLNRFTFIFEIWTSNCLHFSLSCFITIFNLVHGDINLFLFHSIIFPLLVKTKNYLILNILTAWIYMTIYVEEI